MIYAFFLSFKVFIVYNYCSMKRYRRNKAKTILTESKLNSIIRNSIMGLINEDVLGNDWNVNDDDDDFNDNIADVSNNYEPFDSQKDENDWSVSGEKNIDPTLYDKSGFFQESRIRRAVNESFNTIRLQLINGMFYPTDSLSRSALEDAANITKIPEEKLIIISPKLVEKGYKLAIYNYDSQYEDSEPYSNPRKNDRNGNYVENPCKKCNLNGLCDSDDCGKKGFRLFSNKKARF